MNDRAVKEHSLEGQKISLKDLDSQILQSIFKGWSVEPFGTDQENGWGIHATLENDTKLTIQIRKVFPLWNVSVRQVKTKPLAIKNGIHLNEVNQVSFALDQGEIIFYSGDDFYRIQANGRKHTLGTNFPYPNFPFGNAGATIEFPELKSTK